MQDVVSIVVPIYNQHNYLHISIPKILNQSYSSIEVVLVNDGSTDDSLSIIQSYQENDSRIVIVDKPNGGLVDATITGVLKATGEYVCFVDPDDDIGLDYVENFMNEIEDCDFVAMGMYFVINGVKSEQLLREDKIYSKNELQQYQDHFLFNDSIDHISNRLFHARWNKMYRLSMVKAFIPQFSECKIVSLGEDNIFTYLMLGQAQSGKTCRKSNSYFYNMGNPVSMMNNLTMDVHLKKARESYLCLSKLLKENGHKDDLALAMYFGLVSSIFSKTENKENIENALRNDPIYRKCLLKISKSRRIKEWVKSIRTKMLKS